MKKLIHQFTTFINKQMIKVSAKLTQLGRMVSRPKAILQNCSGEAYLDLVIIS